MQGFENHEWCGSNLPVKIFSLDEIKVAELTACPEQQTERQEVNKWELICRFTLTV